MGGANIMVDRDGSGVGCCWEDEEEEVLLVLFLMLVVGWLVAVLVVLA